MNPEVEMTRHKVFHMLKQEYKAKLWDLCIDESICSDSYEKLKELLFDGMVESFKLGEGR
jgi:hypothetical protein